MNIPEGEEVILFTTGEDGRKEEREDRGKEEEILSRLQDSSMTFVLTFQVDSPSSNSESQLSLVFSLVAHRAARRKTLQGRNCPFLIFASSAAIHSILCIAWAQPCLWNWIELLKTRLPRLSLPLWPRLTASRLTA